jgi:RsiW-degrading membrane proteinase PrsW (M82 family)
MSQQDASSLPAPPPPPPPSRPNLIESIIEAIFSLFKKSPPVNYPSGVVYEKLEMPYTSINKYLMIGAVFVFAGFLFVWAFAAGLVAEGSGILGILGVTLAGSIAPLVYVFWMYFNDRFEREPLALIAYTFGWGAVSGIPAALINTVLLAAIPASYIVAPLVEEPLKIIGVYLLIVKSSLGKEFNDHLDGLVYGAAVGSGFAAVENFSYIARSAPFGAGSVLAAVLIRSSTPIMHAFCTGFVGRWLGLSKVRQGRIIWLDLIPGLVVAMLIHGFWNFLSEPFVIGLFGLILVIPISFWMCKFAKEASQDEASWGYATGLAPKE